MPLKHTPARKALASTAWFQHKYPEPGAIGRVTTAKRFQQMQAYSRGMLKEGRIKEIILSTPNEIKAGKQIADYLIQKTGSIKKALKELNQIQKKEILNPFNNNRLALLREIVKHAKKAKIPKSKLREYEKQTEHIISGAHQELIAPFELARMEIENRIMKK